MFASTSSVRSLMSAAKRSRRWSGTPDLGTWLGRVREVWRKVPPVRPTLLTASSVRSMTHPLPSTLPRANSIRPPQPRRMPSTR